MPNDLMEKVVNALEGLTVVVEGPLQSIKLYQDEIRAGSRNRWLILLTAILGSACMLAAQLWILSETQKLVLSVRTAQQSSRVLGQQMNQLLELIESKSEDEDVLEEVQQIKGYLPPEAAEPSW